MLYPCCYDLAATTAKSHSKKKTVTSAYRVGYCSSSYCSHNFTDATSYFTLGVCRSGGCLFPSLKLEHTTCSVPTIHSFDSCMHFIITLVPIQNLSKLESHLSSSNCNFKFKFIAMGVWMGVWMKYCDVKGKAR